MTDLMPNGKLLVLSRRKAQEFTHDSPWACISIHDPEDTPAKINKCQLVSTLVLSFEDVEYEWGKCFKEYHANKILDFVHDYWDKVELLMVHCFAGISRSPAVAAMLAKIYYGDDIYYYENYSPNSLVYRVLYETACNRGWQPTPQS